MQAQPAYACSCVMPGTPEEETEKSDVVFNGTVTEVESSGYGYDVTFQVNEALKGVEDTAVTIHTGQGGGDCGFEFKEGEEYLVYAYKGEAQFEVSICSLTSLLSEPTESADPVDLTYERIAEPIENFNWIFGGAALVLIAAGIAYALKAKKH